MANVPLNHANEAEHRRLLALGVNGSVPFGSAPGVGMFGGTPQTLTGAGAVDVSSAVTHIVTTGANALTLADGFDGQHKYLVMITFAGNGTLTPSNLGNGTTVTFAAVGDSAFLIFTNGNWYFMGGTATLA